MSGWNTDQIPDQIPDQTGRRVLVTAASSSLGKSLHTNSLARAPHRMGRRIRDRTSLSQRPWTCWCTSPLPFHRSVDGGTSDADQATPPAGPQLPIASEARQKPFAVRHTWTWHCGLGHS